MIDVCQATCYCVRPNRENDKVTVTRFAIRQQSDVRGSQIGYALHTQGGKPQKLDIHVLDVTGMHTPFQAAVPRVLETMLNVDARLRDTNDVLKFMFWEYPTFWAEKAHPSLCLSFVLAQNGQPVKADIKKSTFQPSKVLSEVTLSEVLEAKSNRALTMVGDFLHEWHGKFSAGKVDSSHRSAAYALQAIAQNVFNHSAALILSEEGVPALYTASQQHVSCPIPTHINPSSVIRAMWAKQDRQTPICIADTCGSLKQEAEPAVLCTNPLFSRGQFINAVQLSCAISGQVSPFSRDFIEKAAATENDLGLYSLCPDLRFYTDQGPKRKPPSDLERLLASPKVA